jgi:hypothetical protein
MDVITDASPSTFIEIPHDLGGERREMVGHRTPLPE